MSVGLLVGWLLTHSFDDPHVAPIGPLGLVAKAKSSIHRKIMNEKEKVVKEQNKKLWMPRQLFRTNGVPENQN